MIPCFSGQTDGPSFIFRGQRTVNLMFTGQKTVLTVEQTVLLLFRDNFNVPLYFGIIIVPYIAGPQTALIVRDYKRSLYFGTEWYVGAKIKSYVRVI